MPGYKAIGQVGLAGFLYVAAEKLISKVSNYVETGTAVPVRPARHTPGNSAPLPSRSSSETVFLTASIPQNVTATITPLSTLSPSWTLMFSLWSTLQTIVHFFAEQCGELVADLAVHLLFVLVVSYLENPIDQGLRKVLGHLKSTTVDDCIDEEAPTDSSSMWITKATIQLLDALADRIQHRIDNLQAMIANLKAMIANLQATIANLQATIEGATQAITDLCTELSHAKKTITGLERELRDMTDARDKMEEQANNYLADSRQRTEEWEAEKAELSTKHDDALKDSQTKLKEAGEKFDKLEKKLSEATDKRAEDNKRILKLTAQCTYWQNQLEQNKAETDQKIEKAATTAKNNANIAAGRREEIARVDAESKIKMLKLDFEKKEEEYTLAKIQSADEIAALKKALAKKEDDKPASAFNPAATVFMPSPATSSHSTLPSSPHTPITATPFSPSPSAASFPPSPSPNPTTLYQQPPIKKEPMAEHARQNLAEINRRLREQKDREMMGKSAEDAEPKPLSEEELDRRIEELATSGKPLQRYTPAQPTPTPSTPSPTPPPPPPTAPSTPAPAKRHNYQGLKPGAPGTPPIEWPAAPPPPVAGAPTGPRAMRENGGRPPGIPAPRGNLNARGRGNGGSRGRESPQLPAFLIESLAKKEEERKEGGKEGGGS